MYAKRTLGVSLSPEGLAFCFAKVPENSKRILRYNVRKAYISKSRSMSPPERAKADL